MAIGGSTDQYAKYIRGKKQVDVNALGTSIVRHIQPFQMSIFHVYA